MVRAFAAQNGMHVHLEATLPQRSAGWLRVRRGLVTGTRVARVFGLAGRQAQITTVAELVVERRQRAVNFVHEGNDDDDDDDDDDEEEEEGEGGGEGGGAGDANGDAEGDGDVDMS